MKHLRIVTSFGPDMWSATGRALIKSIRVAGQDAVVMPCYEGAIPIKNWSNFEWYCLDRDEFLHKWLRDNRDVIPVHLGGTTKMCDCPNAHIRHSGRHKKGCHWHWMNRNASRWFRKIVSWRAASNRSQRYLLWLDSDCLMRRPIRVEDFEELLGGRAAFIFQGIREAPDTGIVGFDLRNGGKEIIEAVCDRYVSRRYREDHRWDDCWQLMSAIKDTGIKVTDLADCEEVRKAGNNNVIPRTVIRRWLSHMKGTHGSRLGIML